MQIVHKDTLFTEVVFEYLSKKRKRKFQKMILLTKNVQLKG